MAVRPRGLPDRDSGAPRKRQPTLATLAEDSGARRALPCPTRPSRPRYRPGQPLPPAFPGDDYAHSPCAFDFDPLYEDYDW